MGTMDVSSFFSFTMNYYPRISVRLIISVLKSTLENLNPWCFTVYVIFFSQMEVNGIHAFLLLLDHFEFFTELRFIFSSSNNNNTTNNTTLINVSTSFSQSSSVNRNGNTTTISSSSGGGTSTKSDSSRPSVGRTAMSKSSSKGLANR